MSELYLTPTPTRRISAVAILVTLGAMLLWVATRPSGIGTGYMIMLLVFAAGALWLAFRLWRATERRLVLTEEALMEEGGRILCRINEIAAVERGAFAFKPSNGFMIRLNARASRVWAPGLWWRLGRRIGIGGVTPAGQGKAMADVLAARVAGGGRIDID